MSDRRDFIRQAGLGAIGICVTSVFPYCKNEEVTKALSGFRELPHSTAEDQGISSVAILDFLDAIEKSEQEFHGIMIVRHGNVVAGGWWSPFAPNLKHTLYSMSKSFTSTAVGMAVADGKLTIEDSVVSFFPKDIPESISENLTAMKVKHLLTMNTGHSQKPIFEMIKSKNWVKAFLAMKVTHQPGAHFLYNTGASYMLSAIVQKVTEQSTFNFLTDRLFKPLNIEGADWETCPYGITAGGYGLRVRTEDIAKFGQLYLQKGEWNGKQLIPAKWVEEATMKQTDSHEGDNDWSQGYGYQFWRCKPEPGFYRGDGAFGQYCIVIPQKETVIAINSESVDMQVSMNLVWDHILPALGDGTKLPPDEINQKRLAKRLKKLALPALSIIEDSPLVTEISGKKVSIDENEWGIHSITFYFEKKSCKIVLLGESSTQKLSCGNGYWITKDNKKNTPEALFAITGKTNVLSKVAASYTWKDDKTLLINLKFIENIHGDQWICNFKEDQVLITFQESKSIFDDQQVLRKNLTGHF